MHNISKKTIRDAAYEISQSDDSINSLDLLVKIRDLYEKAIVLHHFEEQEQPIEKMPETPKSAFIPEPTADQKEQSELSIQERIRQIMDKASQLETKAPVPQPPVEKIEKQPIQTPAEKTEIITPTRDLEEEFQDAIAADYAADLFEKADKIEITKKSLNDKLSQAQIQIGLNDRIAFVKHLFNGSQVDFNRVLSQLNSFQSLEQATHFINNIVKPDYNWDGKEEYLERFMLLIERKFL